jgi:hypothetical protein
VKAQGRYQMNLISCLYDTNWLRISSKEQVWQQTMAWLFYMCCDLSCNKNPALAVSYEYPLRITKMHNASCLLPLATLINHPSGFEIDCKSKKYVSMKL